MYKKLVLYFIIIGSSVFIIFQLYTFLNTVLFMEANTVPGEEDVVIRNAELSDKRLTITCNVDWGEEVLPEMLEVLSEEDVKITFFVSGKWAKNNPYMLRQMFLGGHEIQSHGYSHKLCSQISAAETIDEIKKTEDTVYNIINIKTTVFAPPSGDYNVETVDVCRDMGYKLSLWSVDTIDWREDSTAAVIKERVLSKELNGAIILMHPKDETVKVLPELIKAICEKGIEIVPLHILIGYDYPI